MDANYHHPAMAEEVLEHLNVRAGGIYVDATVGLGGHSELILGRLAPEGRLICIDRDEKALALAEQRLQDARCTFIHSRFSELGDAMGEASVERVDGVLFDFGVSMMQLKDLERGFSFDSEDLLDMRMDRTDSLAAEEIVNTWREKDLADLIYKYGEEWRSRRVASAIVYSRKRARIRTCRELAGVVAGALGGRKGRTHPATKTFQALRVVVNDEIGQIRAGLAAAMGVLAPGGRLVAISYHSLEDREVKVFIREEGRQGSVKVITKKPLTPCKEEKRQYPSARSARLRCAEAC